MPGDEDSNSTFAIAESSDVDTRSASVESSESNTPPRVLRSSKRQAQTTVKLTNKRTRTIIDEAITSESNVSVDSREGK